ncbi:MAG: glycosyltransferase family 2 protein [Anaerolineaceae bacterium]|jgi:glycosyltransferase involved in cell wall biosynthesis
MDLTLIIPVYNEEQNLVPLSDAVRKSIEPLKLDWEIIFVDDGSIDHSVEILKGFEQEDQAHIRVVELRRNYGQTAAIAAGIDRAQGDIVILLDADLQNDPADIPLLLAKLDEGYDVVSGWRKDRKDNYLTRTLPSNLANGLISWVTGLHLHDYGCTLKAYRREFLGSFHLYGEMHRFIPVYAEAAGAKVTEVVVHHNPRKHGKSNYGLDRAVKVVLDLFTVKFLMSYSAKPMRLFGGVGLGLMASSLVVFAFLVVRKFLLFTSILESPLFQISIVVFILGFQSLLMGLIAELLIRTYHEAQGKSIYTVRTVVNDKTKK